MSSCGDDSLCHSIREGARVNCKSFLGHGVWVWDGLLIVLTISSWITHRKTRVHPHLGSIVPCSCSNRDETCLLKKTGAQCVLSDWCEWLMLLAISSQIYSSNQPWNCTRLCDVTRKDPPLSRTSPRSTTQLSHMPTLWPFWQVILRLALTAHIQFILQ